MKRMKKPLSIVLALIMAFSVLTLAGVNAAAYEQDSSSHYLLPAGDSAETAAKFALGETVYGAGAGTHFYQFRNTAVRDVTLNVCASKAVTLTVSTASGATFTVEGAAVNPYNTAVAAGSCKSVTLSSVPADTYYVQISSEEAAEYSFSAFCADLPDLAADINEHELEMVSSDTAALEISNVSIPDLNYYWEVMDDSSTTDIDESKVCTVNEDGVVSVAFPSVDLPFNRPLKTIVRAVFYYAKDGNMTEPWTKTCSVTMDPPNIYLDPYVAELALHANQTVTVKATTNVKNGACVWESSDPSIVSVSNEGVIHSFEKEGTVILNVWLKYNGEVLRIRREIKVTVVNKPYPVSVQFANKSVSVWKGRSDIDPECTVTYSDGTVETPNGKNIIFISADESVATVSNKGVIHPVGQGETTVTAMTPDGSIQDVCTVKVIKFNPWPPNPIRIIKELIIIVRDYIRQLIDQFLKKLFTPAPPIGPLLP